MSAVQGEKAHTAGKLLHEDRADQVRAGGASAHRRRGDPGEHRRD